MSPRPWLCVALILLTGPFVFGQQLQFGEAIALTNTVYSAQPAEGVLTTSDRYPFLAWASPSGIRLTRLDNFRRVGRPVLAVQGVTELDIVWTGSHFFVAAVQGTLQESGESSTIVGQLVDREGTPVGEPVVLALRGERPRLASNGTHILLLYRTREDYRALRLSAAGVPLAPPEPLVLRTATGAGSGHDIASNGRGFAAMIVDEHDVHGLIFNQLGMLTRDSIMSVFRLDRQADASVALSTDGEDYLGVWPNGSVLLAAPLEANGQLDTPLGVLYAAGNLRTPALTFDGASFHAAAIEVQELARPVRFVEIDPRTRVAEAHEHTAYAAQASSPSIVAMDDQVLASWRDPFVRGIQIRDLRGPANVETYASIGAGEQAVAGAASNAAGVLSVWTEVFQGRTSFHSGIWQYDGGWIETKIMENHTPRLVATDGNEFAVITFNGQSWTPVLLDRLGRTRAFEASVLAQEVFDIVFAGNHYFVAYRDSFGDFSVARLGRDLRGLRTAIVAEAGFGGTIASGSLASDGTNVLAAWQHDRLTSCGPGCDPVDESLWAVLLDPGLQRLIPENLPLAGDDSFHPRVAWDGDEYRTVWQSIGELTAGTVTAAGERLRITRRVADFAPQFAGRTDMDLVELDGMVMLLWKTTDGPFLLITDTTAVPFDAPVPGPRAVARYGNGGVAFFGTEARFAPPHHGAHRVVVRFGDAPGPGPVADSPVISAERIGNRVRITWTAPQEAVRGYRLEYRRGDGAWNEYDQWFDDNQRELNWVDLRYGESLAFRVRAVTEAGMTAYSNPAMLHIGKRRAVR